MKSSKTKPSPWTKDEKQRLASLARSGAGVAKISAELGRYARSVRKMARELGLLLKK